MYSMSICLLPICLFSVMSYVTLLSMEEIKNTYLLTYFTKKKKNNNNNNVKKNCPRYVINNRGMA